MAEDALRVALVTGAGSGIGRATALRLAAPGMALLLHTGSNREGLAAVAAVAEARGAKTALLLGDMADTELPARLVAAALDAFGRLDVLVANAGRARRGGALDLPAGALRDAHLVSVEGFIRLVQAAAPALKAGHDARIVAVSSFVAHVFRPDLGLFAASASARASLEALVRSLSRELAGDGITVNAVAPGLVRKDPGRESALSPEAIAKLEANIPLGRRASPAEIASAIAFLASPEASYVTGQILGVDGGLT